MENISEDLLKTILELKKGINRRFVMGIDGLSRSGKTTLVQRLSQTLKEKNIPVHIFHIDDHIVEREKRYNTGSEEWFEYYSLQWDVKWLKEHLFMKLKGSNQLCLPFYNHESDNQLTHNIELSDDCLIIIEGVFLQRPEWRNFYDYVVYLECPRKERFFRESESTQRNIEKFRTRYWVAEDYYLKTVMPTKQANLVLKGP